MVGHLSDVQFNNSLKVVNVFLYIFVTEMSQVATFLEGGGAGAGPGGGPGCGAGGGAGGGRRRALAHNNTIFPKKQSMHGHKHGRKRIHSLSGDRTGKFHIPHKKRRKDGHVVPPTKFLLGGNICDPLNLGSLQDEEINR